MEADGATIHKGDVWSLSTLPDVWISDLNLIGWWKLDDEGTSGTAKYSEASHAISRLKGWTREGVTQLSLWFTGYPA